MAAPSGCSCSRAIFVGWNSTLLRSPAGVRRTSARKFNNTNPLETPDSLMSQPART